MARRRQRPRAALFGAYAFDLASFRASGAPPKRLLVGTDLSDASERGLELAAYLGAGLDGEVAVAHVQPVAGDGGRAPSASLRKELDAVAAKRSIPMSTHLVVDEHAFRGLMQCADQVDADMIIVAAHGKSARYRMLIGSVSERLARHAMRSVLVAR